MRTIRPHKQIDDPKLCRVLREEFGLRRDITRCICVHEDKMKVLQFWYLRLDAWKDYFEYVPLCWPRPQRRKSNVIRSDILIRVIVGNKPEIEASTNLPQSKLGTVPLKMTLRTALLISTLGLLAGAWAQGWGIFECNQDMGASIYDVRTEGEGC